MWYVNCKYIRKYTVCEHTRLYIFKYVCVYVYHEYVAMYVLQVCFVTWYTSTPCLQSFSGEFCTLRFTSHDGCLLREILGHDSTITLKLRSRHNEKHLPVHQEICLFVFRNRLFFDVASLNRPTKNRGLEDENSFPSQAPPEDGEGSNEARSEEKGNKDHTELGQTSCVFMCFLLS